MVVNFVITCIVDTLAVLVQGSQNASNLLVARTTKFQKRPLSRCNRVAGVLLPGRWLVLDSMAVGRDGGRWGLNEGQSGNFSLEMSALGDLDPCQPCAQRTI